MIRTHYIITILFMLLALPVMGQQLTKKQAQEMQESGEYYTGYGESNDYEKAKQIAKADMAGNISSSVSSSFEYLANENNDGDNIDVNEQTKIIINTYSSAALKDVKTYAEKKGTKSIVHVFMHKSEITKAFNERLQKVKDLAKEAARYEHSAKLADALQYYYMALNLLRSCPDGDKATIERDYEDVNFMSDLYSNIVAILRDVNLKAVKYYNDGEDNVLDLAVTYKGKPAVNFNYKYSFDGDPIDTKDGHSELVLPASAKLRDLRVEAVYKTSDRANIDPVLREVMKTTSSVPFKSSAEVKIDTKGLEKVKEAKTSEMAVVKQEIPVEPGIHVTAGATAKPGTNATSATGVVQALSAEEAASYLTTMQTIHQAIRQRNYESVRYLFTKDGYALFDSLIHYGNARPMPQPTLNFTRVGDEVVCRSIPMSFSFPRSHRTFTEDVVFHIDAEGKVFNVAFGLEKKAIDDVMMQGSYDPMSRQIIVNFLESYKTAYALKRLGFLDQIFSQNALIITGTVVKASVGEPTASLKKKEFVKYTTQTKDQYLQNLRRAFANNEFVNIHFGDNIVKRNSNYSGSTQTGLQRGQEVYGIQIKQDYYSSNYGDEGYLFLLVDLRKPGEPLIHVRAWQPDLDPNIPDGRLSLADFKWD